MVSESRRDSARVFRYLQLRDQSVTPHSVIFVGRKKIKLRTKSGTFHDLAGHLVKKRDCVPPKAGRLASM